ncbi:glycosyltransferase [Legionella steelei]|uniref:Glycosyltransferase n=1 Tax=Legionella steelei TaxID=947033 RepID=A0A0W0ZNU5_9GAMM|nr:glycosyltransferase [Legionella steelei]KTD70740.1 glycosyltransferase [Legionella steelei]
MTTGQKKISSSNNTNNGIPPSIIHFIWIGGTLPEKYLLDSLIKLGLLAKKHGFKVYLWVDDSRNFSKAISRLAYEKYQFDLQITPNNLGIELKDIRSLIEEMQTDPFYQNDNRFKDFLSYVNREMIGFKNLASAADFLRYEILRVKGGYYFDLDTVFLKFKNLELIPEPLPYGIKLHGFVNHNGELTSVNNDVIVAIPHHPVIEDAIHHSIQSYRKLDGENQDFDYILRMLKFPLRKDHTKMDLKRYPYYPPYFGHNNMFFSKRWDYTLDSAGPNALIFGLNNYIKNIQNNSPDIPLGTIYNDLVINRVTNWPAQECEHLSLSNIPFRGASDQTWTNSNYRVKGYDDSSIPSSLFLKT